MDATPGHQNRNEAGAGDMLALVMNGMCDAYKIGLGVLSSITDVANANREVAMSFGGSMPDKSYSGSDGARSADNRRAAATRLADVAPYLADAVAIATASDLRYRQGLAKLAARQQWAFIQTGWGRMTGQVPPTPETSNVLVDDVRAYLREVGEIAVLEARQLERDLALVSENLARAVAPPDPDAPYRRFWAAKA